MSERAQHAQVLDILADLRERLMRPETEGSDRMAIDALKAGAAALRTGCEVCRVNEQGRV